MLKIIGSILQVFGLLYFLMFPVGAGAIGLYTLFIGESSVTDELSNALTVLSFFGMIPFAFIFLGFVLVKKAISNSYFANKPSEILAKLVIVPISIVFAATFAVIVIPFFVYRYYQYRKGIGNFTFPFVNWAIEDWYITLPLYIILVLGVLFTLV